MILDTVTLLSTIVGIIRCVIASNARTTSTRRRGSALEAAILDAAWQELVDRGYANFTLEAVARRAQTSTPVLYRRWASRRELLEATIARASTIREIPIPDTGTLRGDLLAIMVQTNVTRVDLLAGMTATLGEYFDETGSNPVRLRDQTLGQRFVAQTIFDRAVARGEVDEERLTPRVLVLAFDLFRHEVLTTLQPVSGEAIDQILDEVVMPLVSPHPPRERL
jgi:AcrR family transcriptional regulator